MEDDAKALRCVQMISHRCGGAGPLLFAIVLSGGLLCGLRLAGLNWALIMGVAIPAFVLAAVAAYRLWPCRDQAWHTEYEVTAYRSMTPEELRTYENGCCFNCNTIKYSGEPCLPASILYSGADSEQAVRIGKAFATKYGIPFLKAVPVEEDCKSC